MTFAVMLVKNDQPKVIGTLWAPDEANAKAVAPALCTCTEGERLNVCRTEDREIPFRLNATPLQLC